MTRARVVLVGLAAVLLASCVPPRPPDSHRYLDEVFGDVVVERGIVYGHAVDEHGLDQDLHLDVFAPSGDDRTDRPAVLWVHPGGFTGGGRQMMDRFAESWARRGWVSVTVEYRLREGEDFIGNVTDPDLLPTVLDAQHDAQAAVRWLRAHAIERGVDPDRVALFGWSAGAVVAAMVAYNSEDPGDSGTPGESSAVRAAVSLSGCALPDVIGAREPPVLMFHGTEDTWVPYPCAVLTAQRASALGNDVALHSLPGTHFMPEHGEYVLEWTAYFLWSRVAA